MDGGEFGFELLVEAGFFFVAELGEAAEDGGLGGAGGGEGVGEVLGGGSGLGAADFVQEQGEEDETDGGACAGGEALRGGAEGGDDDAADDEGDDEKGGQGGEAEQAGEAVAEVGAEVGFRVFTLAFQGGEQGVAGLGDGGFNGGGGAAFGEEGFEGAVAGEGDAGALFLEAEALGGFDEAFLPLAEAGFDFFPVGLVLGFGFAAAPLELAEVAGALFFDAFGEIAAGGVGEAFDTLAAGVVAVAVGVGGGTIGGVNFLAGVGELGFLGFLSGFLAALDGVAPGAEVFDEGLLLGGDGSGVLAELMKVGEGLACAQGERRGSGLGVAVLTDLAHDGVEFVDGTAGLIGDGGEFFEEVFFEGEGLLVAPRVAGMAPGGHQFFDGFVDGGGADAVGHGGVVLGSLFAVLGFLEVGGGVEGGLGVAFEGAGELLHEVDGFGEIVLEVVVEVFEFLEQGLDDAVVVLAPAFGAAEFFFGFLEGGFGFAEGLLLDHDGAAHGGVFGGEEFLVGLVDLAGAFFDFGLPVIALLEFEPLAQALDLICDLGHATAGLGLEDDEAGAPGVEGVEGADAGFLHGGEVAEAGGVESTLVKVFVDALGFAQEEGGVALGDFGEFFEGLHGGDEFLGEFFVFLVLPGGGEVCEAGVQRLGAGLDVIIEAFQFFGEPAHFLGVHDCLCHNEKGFVGGEL